MSVVIKTRLPEIAGEATYKAALAVAKTAADIEAGAKSRARVDTGHMRSSIKAKASGKLTARVTAGAEYTIYNEYGTTKVPAQPMLRPAAHQAEAPFIAAMKKVFE